MSIAADKLQDPVIRHMRRDFARLGPAQSVAEALAAVRTRQAEGRILYFYVLDDEDRLVGVVPTRRLLLAPLETPIADLMVTRVVAIPDSATVLDACEFFTLHRLLAFPIVDREKRMLGVVDVELYTDEMRELESGVTDELFQLIGVHVAEARRGTVLAGFRARFVWLTCNVVSGVLAAFLAGIFEEELQEVVALALFIPVVLALAEAVSMQSLSLALQLLHGRRPTWKGLWKGLRTEFLTGAMLGLATGALVALAGLLWFGRVALSLSLLGGILGGVTGAALLGFTLPTVLRLLQRDPRVAAGPVALALSDMLTLLVYFSLARWLLAG
jgi:magnesium transporter